MTAQAAVSAVEGQQPSVSIQSLLMQINADAVCLVRTNAVSVIDHMRPLTDFVSRLRDVAPAGVPNFDPADGVDAECLFLLEAPGRKAIGSGFVSRNIPDETANNFFVLNSQAQLPRSRTIIWNAIPWYIGDGKRIRAANRTDFRAVESHLQQLFELLHKLRIVVLVGRKSQQLEELVPKIAPHVEILRCPHPSPLSLNGRPERRREILDCLRHVAVTLYSADNP